MVRVTSLPNLLKIEIHYTTHHCWTTFRSGAIVLTISLNRGCQVKPVRTIVILLLAFGASSCLLSPSYTALPKMVICTDDTVADGRISGCKTLAEQGSAEASARLGDYYDGRNDPIRAYEWYRKAADLNDRPTLRKLYDDYRAGTKVPRNDGLSNEYLQKAAALNSEWAMLILAKRSETDDPNGALSAYLALARANNCFAQARLSLAYYNGDIVARNVAQAYFWGLLATAGGAGRASEYHVEADLFAMSAPAAQLQGMVFTCRDVKDVTPRAEAEAILSADRRQMAQDAATQWAPGNMEPVLLRSDGSPAIAATNHHLSKPLSTPAQAAHPPPVPDAVHGRSNPDDVVLIVGIDGYENAPRAAFAERDAAAFRAFAASAMGLAEDNVKTLLGHGARRLDIERALSSWLPARVKPGRSSVLVYFAGHGLASEDGTDLYLLPYDGDRDLLAESALRRERLIERLKALGAAHVILILDACFSGLSRGGDSLLANSRPVVLTPKTAKAPDGVTILSAAQGSQVSLALQDAGHGLFTYMVLKGLEGAADADDDRQITAAELHAYVADRVEREAALIGHKQTPRLDGAGSEILSRW